MIEVNSAKVFVIDFNRTVFDPDSGSLIAGALSLLEKLSSQFALVLYCKKGEGRDELVPELGLEKFFNKIVFVDEKKPEDFLAIAAEFNASPKEVIVIGDRIRSEIHSAKKAGCKTIWFRQGKFADELPTQEEKPDSTVHSLEEILSLFRE